MKRNLSIFIATLGVVVALGVGSSLLEKKARVEAAGVQAPMFEVDPLWPKPLPNHWLMGMTIGVSVDARENICIIFRKGSPEPGGGQATPNPRSAMGGGPAPP